FPQSGQACASPVGTPPRGPRYWKLCLHPGNLCGRFSPSAAPGLSLLRHCAAKTRIDRRAVLFMSTSYVSVFSTNWEAEKGNIYDKGGPGFVEGEKANCRLRLNCTTQQSRLVGLSRGRIQFNPTLLDEQKNGDLMWTARYVVRDFI